MFQAFEGWEREKKKLKRENWIFNTFFFCHLLVFEYKNRSYKYILCNLHWDIVSWQKLTPELNHSCHVKS